MNARTFSASFTPGLASTPEVHATRAELARLEGHLEQRAEELADAKKSADGLPSPDDLDAFRSEIRSDVRVDQRIDDLIRLLKEKAPATVGEERTGPSVRVRQRTPPRASRASSVVMSRWVSDE